jgi:hypothetical protein
MRRDIAERIQVVFDGVWLMAKAHQDQSFEPRARSNFSSLTSWFQSAPTAAASGCWRCPRARGFNFNSARGARHQDKPRQARSLDEAPGQPDRDSPRAELFQRGLVQLLPLLRDRRQPTPVVFRLEGDPAARVCGPNAHACWINGTAAIGRAPVGASPIADRHSALRMRGIDIPHLPPHPARIGKGPISHVKRCCTPGPELTTGGAAPYCRARQRRATCILATDSARDRPISPGCASTSPGVNRI